MKHFLHLILLILLFETSFSQNLVPNPSFEDYSTCPTGTGEIFSANPWFQPVFLNGNNTYAISSSDYYNSCSIDPNINVPFNYYGFQYPKTGNAYAGFFVYANSVLDYREYIEVKLLKPLNKDKKYCFSFFVSLADFQFATSRIGAHFSLDSITVKGSGSISLYTLLKPIPLVPQVQNPYGNVITDSINWVRIAGEFLAAGGEQFLTIGNFYDDAHTDSIVFSPQPGHDSGAYYYIDDVSLTEVNEAKAGMDKSICPGDTVSIGENGTSVNCSWYPSTGLNSTQLVSPKASPKKSITYYVTIIDSCGFNSTDSVRITVLNCDSLFSDSSFISFPNIFTPNNDNVNDVFVATSKNISSYNCKIFNRYGVEVKELTEQNEFWDGHTKSGEALNPGVYFFIATATGKDEKEYKLKGFVTLLR